jgi:hypothetical protein
MPLPSSDPCWLDLSTTQAFMAHLIARGIDFELREHPTKGTRVVLDPISLVRVGEFHWLRVHKLEVVALLRDTAHTQPYPKEAR